MSPRDMGEEFRVLLIMIMLVSALIFCHALIRIVIMLLRPPKQRDLELQLPQMVNAGGYANPETPIRVALARDEEAVGIHSEATKRPPPAYGLWRESVVCCIQTCRLQETYLLATEGRPKPPFLAAKRINN